MGSEREIVSPLHRAMIGVEVWLAHLPKDMTIDAKMALDNLVATAERQIDQAYRDGASNQLANTRALRMVADAKAAAHPQS